MPTLQAGSFGAEGIRASLPGPQGLGFLLPYPDLVPLGGPHLGDKDGDRMGDEEEQKALILLLPWGQGLIPLEGQRQEVEKLQGLAFLKLVLF